jgi:hypothetical protein
MMRTLQPLSFFVSSVFVLVVGFTVGLGAVTANAGAYNLTVDRVEIDAGSFKKQELDITEPRLGRSCGSMKVKMSRSMSPTIWMS